MHTPTRKDASLLVHHGYIILLFVLVPRFTVLPDQTALTAKRHTSARLEVRNETAGQ